MLYATSEILHELVSQFVQLRVTDPRRHALISVALALIFCIGSWGLVSYLLDWASRPSIEKLLQSALSSDHVEAAQAAQQLDRMALAGKVDLSVVRRMATEAGDDSVRGMAFFRLAGLWDYESMPMLLEALKAESIVIRRSSAGAIASLLGYDHRFPVDGTEVDRKSAIERISTYWDKYKESQLFFHNKNRLLPVRK